MKEQSTQQTFPAYEHHICLVSDQTLPNILPVLQHVPQYTKHLHLITTSSMQAKADVLHAIFKKRSCKVWHHTVTDIQPRSMYQSLDAAHACFVKQEGKSIAVNITGGTKIMAILAAEWAFIQDIPSFYVDTSQDSLLSLQREHTVYALQDVLDVETIFAAQGYTIDTRNIAPITQEKRNLLQEFLTFAIKGGIPVLNACASYALESGSLRGFLNTAPKGGLLSLLELCKQHDILNFTEHEILFRSEEDARFCNGFWLEDFVRGQLYALHAHKYIRSWACAVEVHSATVKNEFDAVFTARNRLFVLECKTSQMTRKSHHTAGNVGKSADSHIFKLEALGDKVGGLMVHKMLISLDPLSRAQEERAKQYALRIVAGKDILQLAEKIKHWIQTC